jgi:hypothetical protein
MAAALLAVQTFGGLPRATEAEARHLVKARRIVEDYVAQILALQPDQIGDVLNLDETPAELDVLAQPHAVEVGDLSLPRLDVAAASGELANVAESLYFPAELFNVLAELFRLRVERTDATLVMIFARLRARSFRLHVKVLHPRKTLLAIAV